MTSPLPWKVIVEEEYDGGCIFKEFAIVDNEGAVVFYFRSKEEADSIVRACNNHERLVDLLNSVLSLECMRDGTEIMLKNAIKQALQSAEGK
jgi:hypothetical protein